MSWELGSMALVIAALAAGFAWYESSRPPSKLVALVAALAALAVAGRVLFAAIPNVQATTDVVLLSGYALGAGPGFVIGALAALVSNLFLGQGPWTPWQMLGWGVVGLSGAALASLGRRPAGLARRRLPLALACALAGFAFGAWMDLFTLLNFTAERSLGSYLTVSAAGLPFNIAHAAGNFGLCMLFGPGFLRLLLRFKLRLAVKWEPEPSSGTALAGSGAFLAGVLLVSLIALPAAAHAGTGSAVGYLERAQNGDGGFGGAPGQGSSQLLTGWATVGLEAGGRRPESVTRGGRSPIDYVRGHAGELRDAGELERTILLLRGAGLSARRFAGRDLVAELVRRRRADGSVGGQVNHTAFAVLAWRAAGEGRRSRVVRAAVRWLSGEQGGDGGFAFSGRTGASDVDDTGAVLQALGAAGRSRSKAVKRAIAYLRRAQRPDGGFGQLEDSRSNAQSTAWAIQGLIACGRDPARLAHAGRSPIAYLRSLQQDDGSFRYSRTSAQTPVWVTAQAIAALARKPLPLRPLHRPRAGLTRPVTAPKPARRPARVHRSAAERRRARARPPATPRTTPATRRVAATRPAAGEGEQGGGGLSPALTVGLGTLAAIGLTGAIARARGRD